jgi:hypothetical protein
MDSSNLSSWLQYLMLSSVSAVKFPRVSGKPAAGGGDQTGGEQGGQHSAAGG